MDSKQIIFSNARGANDCFIGRLHDGCEWNKEYFFKLFDAIDFQATSNHKDDELNHAVNKVNSYILNSVIEHFDLNDLYFISNFNEININEYIERLNIVVDYYYKSESIKDVLFDDDLR